MRKQQTATEHIPEFEPNIGAPKPMTGPVSQRVYQTLRPMFLIADNAYTKKLAAI
jgi:hypothetical protein